jgi:hypothetical protein
VPRWLLGVECIYPVAQMDEEAELKAFAWNATGKVQMCVYKMQTW